MPARESCACVACPTMKTCLLLALSSASLHGAGFTFQPYRLKPLNNEGPRRPYTTQLLVWDWRDTKPLLSKRPFRWILVSVGFFLSRSLPERPSGEKCWCRQRHRVCQGRENKTVSLPELKVSQRDLLFCEENYQRLVALLVLILMFQFAVFTCRSILIKMTCLCFAFSKWLWFENGFL